MNRDTPSCLYYCTNGRTFGTVSYSSHTQKPDADVKIAALSEKSSANAILIRQENGSFVEAIDTALAELAKEGTLKEISKKYFGVDVSIEE